jgi:D-alanine-D-alanine ligase
MDDLPHWSDRFFGPLYPRFDLLQRSDIDAEIQGITRLCKITKEDRIVELCCGYGRLLVPLGKQVGVEVSGIDKSKSLLALARQRAFSAEVPISLLQADLAEFRGNHSFSVAYLSGTSFGYYDAVEKNLSILLAARSLLSKGSIFLLDQANFPKNLCVNESDREYDFEKASTFDLENGLYTGTYNYTNRCTGRVLSFPFRIWLYRRKLVLRLLRRAGFNNFECFGSFERAAFVERDEKLIIVCQAN